MLVKVCGLTRTENIIQVGGLRVNYLGFVFYPSSPRDVSKRIGSLNLSALPQNQKRVAVMVNEPLASAKAIVKQWGFHAVQLHGEETPGYCLEMMGLCEVIKAFPIGQHLPPNMEAYMYCCSYFLFDTATKDRGGSGKTFDHSLLKEYSLQKPFFLSGGIGPTDADNVINLSARHPYLAGIDLNSRFEQSPGVKNVEVLGDFLGRVLVGL